MSTGQGNVVILGATSGIGKEMAFWFAARGWRVGVAGRREYLLNDLCATSPNTFFSQVIDVCSPGSLAKGLENLESALGGINLLVISSGTGFINSGLDDDPEQETISTNVTGFTMAADWAYRYFVNNGGGTLAAITSVGGLLGSAEAPAYSASKAYQITYLDGLRKRAKKETARVKVVDIRPGSVHTDMMKGEGHFWISSPQRAADVACRAILKGKGLQYVTPRWILVGLLARLLVFAR